PTSFSRDWSSDVCSSDLGPPPGLPDAAGLVSPEPAELLHRNIDRGDVRRGGEPGAEPRGGPEYRGGAGMTGPSAHPLLVVWAAGSGERRAGEGARRAEEP